MKALKKLSSTLIFLIFFWIAYCVITLPELDGLGNKTRKPSISVMDSENTLVGSLGDVYGGLIQSENIPQNTSQYPPNNNIDVVKPEVQENSLPCPEGQVSPPNSNINIGK